MNEGTLKKRWRDRVCTPNGIFTQAMSPHSIPGLPDLRAVDLGGGDMMVSLSRVREHRIEAKVANLGPRTEFVWDAKRDATAHQTLWLTNDTECGLSGWWLILSPDAWVLLPTDKLKLSRTEWDKRSKPYSAEPTQLYEPEDDRQKRAKRRQKVMLANKSKVVKLFS